MRDFASRPLSICIITVNWKGFEHTRRFSGAVQKNPTRGVHLVIVNNDPEEKEDVDSLRREGVTVLHNDGNLGYAKALNQGIHFALETTPADHLLLMNNDTLFEPDFLKKLSACSSRDTIYSPVILTLGTDIIQNTGGKLSFLLGGARGLNRKSRFEGCRRATPDFLSGCCLYMHRDVIGKVGLFDSSYHSYCEDVDYSLRARTAGVSLEVVWDLKLWHHHSASTTTVPGHKVHLLSRNTIILARRFIPPPARWIFITTCVARGFFQNVGRKTFTSYLRGTREDLSR